MFKWVIWNYWRCFWDYVLFIVTVCCCLLFQSYGIQHLLTFANLKQLGLLQEQQTGETLTVMESKVGKLVNDKTAGENLDKCNLFFSLTLIFITDYNVHILYMHWVVTYVFCPGKLTDAFSSLAKKSNFRALSKKLALVSKYIQFF